ncbi:MAG: hypothetical protein WAT52_04520 [Chitinophagales bacterium]
MDIEEPVVLEYNNIMIYTDLSNRLKQSPNDTMVINQIVNYFITDCVRPGIKVNDRSSIAFSRLNIYLSNCAATKIDIGEIKTLEEKQLYVNDKSKTKTLSDDIKLFKENVACNYMEQDKGGLDILSLLYSEINSGNHIKKPKFINGEFDTTTINYSNHIFLFTDGYLEFSKEGDLDFYFGQKKIESVRIFCKANNVSAEDAIKSNSKFKLRPLKCENNKYVTLYIMETYDRGLNELNGTLKNTGDLSDNNILKTVWETWAYESGFKNFVWKQMTKPNNLPNDYIKTVIVKQ